MSDGWVKIHRSMMNWEWWDDINTRALWLTILLSANHKATRWHGQVIKAGQFVTSYGRLADLSGLSNQQVRTALNRLKETGEVMVESTNKYTLISVVKWADYQLIPDKSNKQITNKQQTNNKQITTNKNIKNKRSKENIYTAHFRFTPPDYIIQQINGTLPEETPASAEEIDAIKQLQEKMKC